MESGNVYLRALEPDDYLVSYRWRNDFKLIQGYSQPRFVSRETEKKWVLRSIDAHEKGDSVKLAICTRKEDKLIGYVNLLKIDHINKNCEYSILIGDRQYHQRGYSTEIRILCFEYGFLEMGMERITLQVFANNKAGIAATENRGLVKESVYRKAIFQNGVYQDVVQYSMLRSEFLARYV